MEETIAGGAQAEAPSNIASTTDIVRVAAIVAAGMIKRRRTGTAGTIGEAAKTGSIEVGGKASGEETDEKLTVGDALGDWENGVVPAKKRSLKKLEAAARAAPKSNAKFVTVQKPKQAISFDIRHLAQ